ncbi:methyltransferase [Salmonella enterica subsp. enterica serovar Give]|nr:methyltransferase [Salmonella enterica subsp. enterica serovar Give]ECM4405519.1 methyltransferase [Salmonella enterica subsp. enterica serovar Give]EED4548211.1 methyltransferase [Salmonella enterica subsp. enterica serovar Give]
MKTLIKYLISIGYSELCSSLFPGTPRLDKWKKIEPIISDDNLKNFYLLLLVNKSVNIKKFNQFQMNLLQPLIESRILSLNGCKIKSVGYSLFMVLGNWLIFETPNINPKIYYGDDSFALLTRLRPIKNGTTLDLCAGPGIQSIYCSSHVKNVTSVEINPLSAAIAEINREINALPNWDIKVGDLYGALEHDEKYDHIICNPPLLPFPDDLPYPFVGHGGNDGWAVTWRVLDGMPKHLKKGGHAQIIGTTLSDGIEVIIMTKLINWAKENRMDCILTLMSQNIMAPGEEYFEGLALSSSFISGNTVNETQSKMEDFLRINKAISLVSTSLLITHGKGDVKVIDLLDVNRPYNGLWYL